MKSSWWIDKYDVDKQPYKSYSGKSWWSSSYKSATKGWMDKLGGFGWFDFEYKSKEDKERRIYKKVLNQLQTSINVISGDNNLNVRWSDGENQNSPENQIVYVSPDKLIDEETNGVSEDTIDILTGKVYLSSILNKQVSKQDYEIASIIRNKENRDPSYPPTIKLWEALETNVAKKFVEDNWCGFMPHIIKHGESICSRKDIVQNFIDSSTSVQPNLQAVTAGIAWNLVNPEDCISIPKVYENCIDAAIAILEDPASENKRFNSCQLIVKQIQKILAEQDFNGNGESEGEENEGDESKEDGEENGEGEVKEGSKSGSGSCDKLKAQKAFKKLIFSDSELFGLNVKNCTDSSLSLIKNDKDEISGSSLVTTDRVDLSSLENKFEIPDLNYDKDYALKEYGEIVNNLRNSINAVKNNFYFVNNKLFSNSYGHNSGDVDENNLHKIFLNDDRLMQRRDIVSQKKISVCLLIDESGSMEDKYIDARDTAIILAEGLKNYFDISIYGHTAESSVSGCLITEYFTPRSKNIESCINITSKCENVDGLAIELVAKKFADDYPDSRRIMFVISDGEPASSYYGGSSAEAHVNKVCEMVRNRLETEVYGIGVCEAYSEEAGESLYNAGNYVIIEDVNSSVGIITRFLKQICNKNLKVFD